MASVTVTHLCEDQYRLETRGHVVLADQPRADTLEVGPTPVELLVLAIAGCAAHYAVGYLRANGLSEGLRVDCRWTMRANPPRLGRVELALTPAAWLAPEHHRAMLAAVERCTVTNSLRQPPEITVMVPAETPA